MLDYTTCCKLRDAGLPQETSHEVSIYYSAGKPEWGIRVSFPLNAPPGPVQLDADEIRIPNSDELIAATQQRWPGDLDSIEFTGQSVKINEHVRGGFMQLDEALANHYLARAGGENG